MDLEGFVKLCAHGVVNTALLWVLWQYFLFVSSILLTLRNLSDISVGLILFFFFLGVPIFYSLVIGFINQVVSKWLWSFDLRMSKIDVWFYGFILLILLGIAFVVISPFLLLTYVSYAILLLVNGFISKKVAEDHATWLFLLSKIGRKEEP